MAQSQFSAGQYVSEYRLIRKLGQGAFGEVWLAERASRLIASQVALKLPFDPDRDMIQQEAQTWIRASGHPNIVPVWDAGIDSHGQAYIASEYVDGGTLTDWLQVHDGKAPTLQEACRLMKGILTGLEHLHGLRPYPVVHRDLKPDNILMQGGVPRLTDFGIARVMTATGYTQNQSGTPRYMAPEVFSGRYSERSDLWAAAVIFYRLLTGALPYPQQDLNALLGAIVLAEPPPLPPDMPAGLQPIFARALAKDPSMRYASAQEMRADVERLLYAPSAPSGKASPLPQPQLPQAGQATPQPAPASKTQPATASARVGGPSFGSRRRFLRVAGVSLAVASICAIYALCGLYLHHKDGLSGENEAKIGGSGSQKETIKEPQGPQASGLKQTNPIDGADLVEIPPGEFTMGSRNGYGNETPVHQVYVSRYYIYKNLVTVKQYLAYCAATGHPAPPTPSFDPNWSLDDHPIVNVSWDDASAYAQWAGAALPTEAQWEKAARGTDGRKYPWGNEWVGDRCANSVMPNILSGTQPVGSYPEGASPYGVLDMVGNVWEWCSDWYSDGYQKHPNINPTGPQSSPEGYRVLRGGSWNLRSMDLLRCSARTWLTPDSKDPGNGFRCVVPAGK